MVHNGTGHKLLLDFLWAHPNSLDWPIKSSGGPNNVCDIYMNIFIYIYIYIYIYRGVCAFGGGPLSLLFSLKNTPGHSRTHSTLD